MPPLSTTAERSARPMMRSDWTISTPFRPINQFLFMPTRELWPAESVNGVLPPVQMPVQAQRQMGDTEANHVAQTISPRRTNNLGSGVTGDHRRSA